MIEASMNSEPRRIALSLPRPLWLGLAAVVLGVAVFVLQAGVPTYREQVASSDLERAGGVISTRQGGPEWLRRQIGDAGLVHLKGLKRLQKLSLGNTRVTDSGVADLEGALPGLRIAR